jgi:adenylate cyclase
MIQSAERKLTTILSADAVGYSRLMGQDETGTFATLKAYRELTAERVAHHRGRVVNTAGDSILAEFPSVVRAVECAVETQRLIAERNAALAPDKQMWFRIGVNLGDVMVDNDDLFGDGVNVAARLQAMADPGGILISGTVFEHVKDKLAVSFDALGVQTVKNISTRVPVYRVVLEHGRDGPPQQAPQPQPVAASIETPDATMEARRRRSYMNVAIAGALVVFLFGINLFTDGAWWFQWPSLAILLVYALRTISLFKGPDVPRASIAEPQALRKARMHQFFVSTAIAGTLIVFFLGINVLSGSREIWFQWPSLAILIIFAIRMFFLFRKPIV